MGSVTAYFKDINIAFASFAEGEEVMEKKKCIKMMLKNG